MASDINKGSSHQLSKTLRVMEEAERIDKLYDKIIPKHIEEYLRWEEEQSRINRGLVDAYQTKQDAMEQFLARKKATKSFMEEMERQYDLMHKIDDFNDLSTSTLAPAGIPFDEYHHVRDILEKSNFRNTLDEFNIGIADKIDLLEQQNKYYQKTDPKNLLDEITNNLSETLSASASLAEQLRETVHYQGEIYYQGNLVTNFVDIASRIEDLHEFIHIQNENITFNDKEILNIEQIKSILYDLYNEGRQFTYSPLAIFQYGLNRLPSLNLNKIAENIISQIIYTLIFIFIINPMIGSFIQPSASSKNKRTYVKENIEHSKKNIMNAPSLIKNEKSIRGVIPRILNVRLNPSKKSRIINKLYGGSVVLLIDKRKKWSYVRWSKEGLEYRGWVYNKYITKLNRY